MDILFMIVVLVIILAVVFDFVNGFHDAANVVATMIASRSMSPESALIIAAVAEFLGPLIFGTAVAKTIGKEIVDPKVITVWVVCGALSGAIVWNLLTWWFGLPSSSSHALVGGIVGSVLAAGGADHLKLHGVMLIVIVLVTSPLIGFLIGYMFQKASVFLMRGQSPRVNELFKRSQLFSSVALALSHGSNDAQKSMGIITMVLVSYGYLTDFIVPTWAILVCATSMGLGTAFGGWKIIKTVGSGLYRLRPIHGFSAQSSSAFVILTAALCGGPVSTTHVVSSSIMGVGGADRIKAVRWHKAGEIVSTWFLTIPAAAAVSAATYGLIFLARQAF